MKKINNLFSPKIEVWVASALLLLSVILWPVSMFTFAKEEPPAVLSLSWLALLYSSFTAIIAAQSRKDK